MIKIEREQAGHVGVLSLNSPNTLNALSLAMIEQLHAQLNAWQEDDDIACVIIRGEGDRAFCAGGDIQAIYHAMQASPGQACALAEQFFTEEYRLDYSIHTFNKPIIVWGNGIVMGGGLGLFAGADFRVVTERSRVAMPEITIGLYPDAGGSYFLNKMPSACGRFLGLTGASINAQDCLFLGLANAFVRNGFYQQLLDGLNKQNWQLGTAKNNKGHNSELIAQVLKKLSNSSLEQLPQGNIEPHLDTINDYFNEADLAVLLARFNALRTQDEWLVKAQKTLQNGSPLSARLIDKQLRLSRKKDLKAVFQSELILSSNIAKFTELSEGIRALLIDKDGSPNWHYSDVSEIPDAHVDDFFVSPWTTNPLHDL